MAGPFAITPSAGDGATTIFTIANPVSSEQVFLGGLLRVSGTDYALVNSTTACTITFTVAPVLGESVLVYGTPAFGTSAATYSKNSYLTAGTIINRCAVQCGLSSVADPYASTDANFVQLREMLNMIGEDLQNEHEWSHFVRETTITTAASATSYVMPSDFYRFVDDTQWNRSTRFRMIGPISGQETQYLKALLSGVLIQVAYRLQGNVITFPIAPSNGQTLAFEYVTNFWVWSAAGTSPDSTSAVATGDTVLYDPDLAIAALKLAYLDAKGFDTVRAEEKYDAILEAAIYKNVGARTISIGGSGINPEHLIDATNLPVTGY